MKLLKHKLLNRLLLLPVSVLIINTAMGQGGSGSTPPAAQLPKIIQASPEAASLGKYGNQQIGLNTGTVSAHIPLYELKTKSLKLGIGLNYSSNGLKVDEISSRVGMGWVLNASGVITRTVYDKPDLLHPRIQPPLNLNFHLFDPNMISAAQSYYTTDPAILNWLDYYSGTDSDMQLDEFNFNFNGYTGKFIFDNNNSPVLLPQSNLKIEFNSANTDWNFKITTPDGTKYYFGGPASEITLSSTGYSNHDQYVSAWYLNKIESGIDPSDNISFNYAPTSFGYITGISESMMIKSPDLIPNISFNGAYREYSAASGGNADVPTSPPSFTIHSIGFAGVYLQSISASGYGTIKFSYQNKPDIIAGQDFLVSNMEIDAVPNQPMFSYSFVYDVVSPNPSYNNSSSSYYPLDFFNSTNTIPRPFLKQVITSDKNGIASRSYSFLYNDFTNLAPHLSFSQDHWGYFNGKNTLNSLISPAAQYYSKLDPTIISNLSVNRDVDYDYAQKGILTQINYPTGGYTKFTFEGNSINGATPTINQGDIDSSNPLINVNSVTVSSNSTPSQTFQVQNPVTVNITMNISCNCPSGGCTILPDNTLAGQLILNQTTAIGNFDYSAYNARGDCSRSSGYTYTLQPGSYNLGLLSNNPYILSATISTTDGQNGLLVSYNQVPNHPIIPVHKAIDGSYFGGVRVKQNIDYDQVKNLTTTTTYGYSGLSGSYTPTYQVKYCKYGLGALQVTLSSNYTSYTSPNFPLDYAEYYQLLNGTYCNLIGRNAQSVTYTNVSETFGVPGNINGEIDHVFSYDVGGVALATKYAGHVVDNLTIPDYFWRNGLELSKSTYKLVGSVKVPVESINNVYYIDPRISNRYEQFNIKKNSGDLTLSVPNVAYSDIPAYWSNDFGVNKRESVYDVYSITTKQEWQYLSQTQKVIYDINGLNPVTTIENYFYDNPTHLLLTRIESSNSKSEALQTINKYVGDESNIGNLTTTELDAIAKLKTQYRISSLLEKDENKNGNLINRMRIGYKDWGNGILANQTIYTQTGGNILEPRIQFMAYDNHNNLQSVSKSNGSKIIYIYGYNGQYPVAQIINTDYSLVESALGGSAAVQAFRDNPNPSDIAINSFLAPLRNVAVFPSALITTYTYAPLVGMTSSTDAKGLTTYFEYDSFQRLTNVRDQDGNILKHTDYHYQNQ